MSADRFKSTARRSRLGRRRGARYGCAPPSQRPAVLSWTSQALAAAEASTRAGSAVVESVGIVRRGGAGGYALKVSAARRSSVWCRLPARRASAALADLPAPGQMTERDRHDHQAGDDDDARDRHKIKPHGRQATPGRECDLSLLNLFVSHRSVGNI